MDHIASIYGFSSKMMDFCFTKYSTRGVTAEISIPDLVHTLMLFVYDKDHFWPGSKAESNTYFPQVQ